MFYSPVYTALNGVFVKQTNLYESVLGAIRQYLPMHRGHNIWTTLTLKCG